MYPNLQPTNREYLHLVGIIVMRDPLEQGKCYAPLDQHQYPPESLGPGNYFKGVITQWMQHKFNHGGNTQILIVWIIML